MYHFFLPKIRLKNKGHRYRYHSVNVITFGQAQIDHINRVLVYLVTLFITEHDQAYCFDISLIENIEYYYHTVLLLFSQILRAYF